MKKYQVYLLTFPNGKQYCGRCINLQRRARSKGEGYSFNQPKVYKAIQKYGWNNVKKEILFYDLTLEEANSKEIETIKKLNLIENGYNILPGGNLTRKGIKQPKSYFKKRNSHGKYRVLQCDLQGNIIKEFAGVAIASRETGCNLSKIAMCCKGQRKKCGGFIWKKVEN